MKKYLWKINLSVFFFLSILSAGFAFFCYYTSANYNRFEYYMLFYIITLILSVPYAFIIRKSRPSVIFLWPFAILFIGLFILIFLFTQDLYITSAVFLFWVIVLTAIWSSIAYLSLSKAEKSHPFIGWFGIFIAVNLLTGWIAWFSGDRLLARRHAQNLLICRQKAMQIAEQIKRYKQTNRTFPKTLDELNLKPELTTLPFSEFKYCTLDNIYFTITFDETLLTGAHKPDIYEYEYIEVDDKSMKDGWTIDPIKTIQYLYPSLITTQEPSSTL